MGGTDFAVCVNLCEEEVLFKKASGRGTGVKVTCCGLDLTP